MSFKLEQESQTKKWSFDQFCSKVEEAVYQYGGQSEQMAISLKRLLIELDFSDAVLKAYQETAWPIASYKVSSLYRSKTVAIVAIKIAAEAEIMPHNHPAMVGAITVVSGCVDITSFAAPSKGKVQFLERSAQTRLKPGDTASLTPEQDNYHYVRAIENSLLVDIFSPPYSLRRPPTNYQLNNPELINSQTIVPVQKVGLLKLIRARRAARRHNKQS